MDDPELPQPSSGAVSHTDADAAFDDLLREACADEESVQKPEEGPRTSHWLPVASLGALLVGVAGILAVPLLAAAPGPSAQGAPVAAEQASALPDAAGAIADAASSAVPDGARAGVDPVWVAEVAERTGIPDRALAAYAGAAARMSLEHPACGIGWNTLAGIGHVESEHGAFGGARIAPDGRAVPPIIGIALDGTTTERIPDTDGGALDGDSTWDRAVGPMQFIPSTWAIWGGDGDGDGVRDPQQIDDAAYSAARYLCSTGGDLRDPERWIAAVAAYNDTIEYNHLVAEAANHYARLG